MQSRWRAGRPAGSRGGPAASPHLEDTLAVKRVKLIPHCVQPVRAPQEKGKVASLPTEEREGGREGGRGRGRGRLGVFHKPDSIWVFFLFLFFH